VWVWWAEFGMVPSGWKGVRCGWSVINTRVQVEVRQYGVVWCEAWIVVTQETPISNNVGQQKEGMKVTTVYSSTFESS